MKNLKRILSIVLILVLALSFAGCHKKGEIAVEIGEWKFTSAYYMCAFIQAEREAQATVYESLSDKEKQDTDLDYTKKKIGDKKYEEWVKDTAIDYLKEIAALKTFAKENKLDTNELKDTYNQMLPNIWEDTSYGYYYASMYFGDTIPQGTSLQMNYEPNGVSQATYLDFVLDKTLYDSYFEFLYVEGGSKEIAFEDIEKEFYGNYELANVLEASFEEKTEQEITELKAKIEGYKASIEKGEMTFAEVKADYEKPADEDEKEETDEHDHEEETEENTEVEEETEENTEPKDENAQLITSDNDNYKTIKAMSVGEVKIVETDTAYILIVKQDLKADEYYIKQNDLSVRHTLKDEEFSKLVADAAKKLKADIDKYAVNQFKVKKLEIPEAVSSY